MELGPLVLPAFLSLANDRKDCGKGTNKDQDGSKRYGTDNPEGTSHEAHLFGLEPFLTSHVSVVAVNSAGRESSPWTLIRTLESSPSELINFTADLRENGRALLLQWTEPERNNGERSRSWQPFAPQFFPLALPSLVAPQAHLVFSDGLLENSGLGRQFLFRLLAPFTLYTLTPEACTAAGCAHSEPQPL
ncbi:hypothetical protein ACRRTK_005180 [Alexandromys fortis]